MYLTSTDWNSNDVAARRHSLEAILKPFLIMRLIRQINHIFIEFISHINILESDESTREVEKPKSNHTFIKFKKSKQVRILCLLPLNYSNGLPKIATVTTRFTYVHTSDRKCF
jgi:hypothetical protein